MVDIQVLLWALLALFLLLVYYLLQRLQQRAGAVGARAQARGSGNSNRRGQGSSSSSRDEQSQRQMVSEQQRKMARLEKILEKDPELAKDIVRHCQLSGEVDPNQPPDEEALRKMVARMNDRMLDMLEAVADAPVVELDFESGQKLVETDLPSGSYMEYKPMTDLSQIATMDPMEWALPDDLRTHRILSGEVMVPQYYDFVPEQKLIYILEDGSGSMDQSDMSNGEARYVWSRGRVLKICRMAIQGQTRFVYRDFTETPGEMIRVLTPEDAQAFFDHLMKKHRPTGGTTIFKAFEQAVKDIRSGDSDISKAEILLITDGDDTSMNDKDVVQAMLGSDIRLHCVMIGGENQSLKQVAHSYVRVR